MPCRDLCPTVVDLPERTVGDYLAEQDITAGELAHDAYAALAYGFINAALVIADAGEITRAELADQLAAATTWSEDERATWLGAWYDLLTIPDLRPTSTVEEFIAAHGRLLASRIQSESLRRTDAQAMADAARLEIVLALHLGATVGADPAAMAALITPPATA
jgi:hypothetical protein